MTSVARSAENPSPAPPPLRVDDMVVRPLAADESARLGDAIRAVYGDTYPIPWVYDSDEVARRLGRGLLISVIAETADGDLLCHSGLTLDSPDDVVGHGGQAVTLPAARGKHIFTKVKQYMIDWVTERGIVGMYSEATATHPYSEKALLDLGGHETGFLLGFIPESEDNSVSSGRIGRQSAALFYLRLRSGQDRLVYAPERHAGIVRDTIEICNLRARLAETPTRTDLPPRSDVHVQVRPHHNIALVTVLQSGADLTARVEEERARLFDDGVDVLYVDLPLDQPATAQVGESLEELRLTYSGIFPNNQAAGDVLRLQSLRNATALCHDIVVASPHGAALLDYVVADMEAAGQPVVKSHEHPAAAELAPSSTLVPSVTTS